MQISIATSNLREGTEIFSYTVDIASAQMDMSGPPKFDSFTPRATPELNPDKHLAAY